MTRIVKALARDLTSAAAPGGLELLALLDAPPMAHVRHFEYLQAGLCLDRAAVAA